MTSAADLLRAARLRAGLSQAELARRADMPRSVVNAYERGHRDPGAVALIRLVRAAGLEIRAVPVRVVDEDRAGRILADVLDLAEALPARPPGPLEYPALPRARRRTG